MKSQRASVVAVAVTVALLAGGALAAPRDKADTIRIDRAAIVGSSVLPSGNYRIELASDPDIVKFVRGGRIVAEAPYKLSVATVEYPGYAVHYRTAESCQNRLVKIVLSDSKLAIEVAAPGDAAGDAPIAATAE